MTKKYQVILLESAKCINSIPLESCSNNRSVEEDLKEALRLMGTITTNIEQIDKLGDIFKRMKTNPNHNILRMNEIETEIERNKDQVDNCYNKLIRLTTKRKKEGWK